MIPTHCCDSMGYHVKFNCTIHKDLYKCPDSILKYSDVFDEYGIIIHDGGTSSITISYCPFCGIKLPDSKRDLWYETMESISIDPWDDTIPEPYNQYGWWLTTDKGTNQT